MPIKKPSSVTTNEDYERRHTRDFQGLLCELAAAEPSARRWAARDLASTPAASTALAERLYVETDTSVREVLLTSLTCIGDGVAIDALVNCLRSEDAGLRNEAIEAMAKLSEPVVRIIEQLLHDRDSDVRLFAINILATLRHPQVESWLIEVLERDPHINVCAGAIDVLVEVGSSAARPALESMTWRFPNEPYIWFASKLALKRIGEG
ncbi:PBS lyase [Pseudomonas sp. 31-12]|uniref:HEAT repeat domain-containing protein n=1 Tax=Pseudomonas sp. 31-12 TaxID=2201356 RepID=UPI000D6C7F83|nr:HEAT repeat domain-containing protein [Pseudomonas sp. 31-12]AWM93734.1 PBS lyase [Pseudomonas sp. 31-12]